LAATADSLPLGKVTFTAPLPLGGPLDPAPSTVSQLATTSTASTIAFVLADDAVDVVGLAVAGVDDVVAERDLARVVRAAGRGRVAVDRVAPGTAGHRVVAQAALDVVVAGAAVDGVVEVVADQLVVAAAADQGRRAGVAGVVDMTNFSGPSLPVSEPTTYIWKSSTLVTLSFSPGRPSLAAPSSVSVTVGWRWSWSGWPQPSK
jgi:hypothetical protein